MTLGPAIGTIDGWQQAVHRGEKAAQLIADCLTRVRARSDLGAFVLVDEQGALDQAARLDAALARGAAPGPLHGVPVAVKDCIDVGGLPTRCGTSLRDGTAAAVSDATAVARWRQAGAVVVGKTAMHELAAGFTTPSCTNPLDALRVAGGSSGGSAVAVAAGLVLGALGTDSLGSVRVPAAFCGTVGLKPTAGVLPTAGVHPLSWSLDHVGILAANVADTQTLFRAAAGSVAQPRPRAPRVGVPIQGMAFAELEQQEAVQCAADSLRAAGVTVVEVSLDQWDLVVPTAFALLMVEAAIVNEDALRETDGVVDPGVRSVLDAGVVLPASTYLRAQSVRRSLRRGLQRLFADQRLTGLLMPSAPGAAPEVGASTWGTGDPIAVGCARLNALFNLTGLPSLGLPTSTTASGMPLSVQIVGRPYDEHSLFELAAAVERDAATNRSRDEPDVATVRGALPTAVGEHQEGRGDVGDRAEDRRAGP